MQNYIPICHEKYFKKELEYYNFLENSLKKHLKNILIDTCCFSFIPENFSELYNIRSSFFVANFLKQYVKDKHFCHIGGASGDFELLLSKYAKKITIIEKDLIRAKNIEKKKKENLYKCPVDIIYSNFFDVKIDADIFFTWCGLYIDFDIIDHFKKNYKNCILFAKALPCYNFTNNIDKQLRNDYLIPFDENFKISYYSNNNVIPKMMKNNINQIILILDENVFLYDSNMELKNIVSNKEFNFDHYEDYIHPYMYNLQPNSTPASEIRTFLEASQINLRGYIPLGFIIL